MNFLPSFRKPFDLPEGYFSAVQRSWMAYRQIGKEKYALYGFHTEEDFSEASDGCPIWRLPSNWYLCEKYPKWQGRRKERNGYTMVKQYNRKRVGSENAWLTVKRPTYCLAYTDGMEVTASCHSTSSVCAICMCLTMEEWLIMSFRHAALRFRVWVGRSGKRVDASMRLEEDVRLVWTVCTEKTRLTIRRACFCTYRLAQVALTLVAAVKDAAIANAFCDKAYKSCINGNVYVYKEVPQCIKGGMFEEKARRPKPPCWWM